MSPATRMRSSSRYPATESGVCPGKWRSVSCFPPSLISSFLSKVSSGGPTFTSSPNTSFTPTSCLDIGVRSSGEIYYGELIQKEDRINVARGISIMGDVFDYALRVYQKFGYTGAIVVEFKVGRTLRDTIYSMKPFPRLGIPTMEPRTPR